MDHVFRNILIVIQLLSLFAAFTTLFVSLSYKQARFRRKVREHSIILFILFISSAIIFYKYYV